MPNTRFEQPAPRSALKSICSGAAAQPERNPAAGLGERRLQASTTLVLLPGLDGTDILFRPFVQALPSWITARCVEYPTSGPNDYAALLPLALAACNGLENYFVLGWSFSGPLALMTVAKPMPGLRGVVLCASFTHAPWPLLRWFKFSAVAPMARLYPLFSWLLAVGGSYETPELRRDKLASFRRVPASVFAARSRAVLGVDVRAELRRCRVRLLYLAGSHDIVVPRWNAKGVKTEFPAAEVVTIAGPHLALRTNPVAAAEAVSKFIVGEGSA
jgi:pimeloyl-[acyl-carrier protein] methyl ester esterase